MDALNQQPSPKEISGRWMVVGLLGLGIAAGAFLWVYAFFDQAPFREFQHALAKEFPNSAPRIKGGQRKMHKGTPPILWVALQVDFNPQQQSERVKSVSQSIIALAQQHMDLKKYEQLEIQLIRRLPEQKAEAVTIKKSVSELTRGTSTDR